MGLKTKVASWVLGGAIALAVPVVTYYEGFEEKVYLDPVGIPTVCYGHVVPNDVAPGTMFTKTACDDLLKSDLKIASDAVDRLVTVALKPYEKAAFISFVFNAGAGNFAKSTMLKLANKGRMIEACHELPKWVYAKGQKLPGLVKRRQAEMQLCLGNV